MKKYTLFIASLIRGERENLFHPIFIITGKSFFWLNLTDSDQNSFHRIVQVARSGGEVQI
ncbi:MAG: hypothetical protein EA360_05515 [Balneolaceae bacterium]|nr:MAG: hypothetical protein EA360_05515 [Balneolaceae bacterium]